MNILQEITNYYDSLSKKNQATMDAIVTSLILRRHNLYDAGTIGMKAMKRKLARLSEGK